MANEIKIKKILQEHITSSTIVADKTDMYMYFTEKGNMYINNKTDGKLLPLTDLTFVTSLPVMGDLNKIYILNNKTMHIWDNVTLKFLPLGEYEGSDFLKDGVSINNKTKSIDFIGSNFKLTTDGTNANKIKIEFVKDKTNVVDKADANIVSDLKRLKFIGAKVENEGGATDNGQIKITVDPILIEGNTQTVMSYNDIGDIVSVTVFNADQTSTISNTQYNYNATTGNLEEEAIAYVDYNVTNTFVYDSNGNITTITKVIS